MIGKKYKYNVRYFYFVDIKKLRVFVYGDIMYYGRCLCEMEVKFIVCILIGNVVNKCEIICIFCLILCDLLI